MIVLMSFKLENLGNDFIQQHILLFFLPIFARDKNPTLILRVNFWNENRIKKSRCLKPYTSLLQWHIHKSEKQTIIYASIIVLTVKSTTISIIGCVPHISETAVLVKSEIQAVISNVTFFVIDA